MMTPSAKIIYEGLPSGLPGKLANWPGGRNKPLEMPIAPSLAPKRGRQVQLPGYAGKPKRVPDWGTRPNDICLDCLSRTCVHVSKPYQRLAPREAQVLLLLSGALSNKEIAQEMGCVVNTVKSYTSRAFRALGLTTRLEAAIWALHHVELLRPHI